MLHFRDHDDGKYKIYNRGVGLELILDGRGGYYCRDKPSVDVRAARSSLQKYRLLTQSLWELAEGNIIGSSVLYPERKLTLSCATDRRGSPRSSTVTDNFGGVALNLRHTVGERGDSRPQTAPIGLYTDGESELFLPAHVFGEE